MSQVSLGRPEFVPGTPPGHPDRQIPSCDFSLSVFFSPYLFHASTLERKGLGGGSGGWQHSSGNVWEGSSILISVGTHKARVARLQQEVGTNDFFRGTKFPTKNVPKLSRCEWYSQWKKNWEHSGREGIRKYLHFPNSGHFP